MLRSRLVSLLLDLHPFKGISEFSGVVCTDIRRQSGRSFGMTAIVSRCGLQEVNETDSLRQRQLSFTETTALTPQSSYGAQVRV